MWTIVVAAGAGTRFGRPKQFDALGGRRVVDWAIDDALAVSEQVVVVVPAGHRETGTSAADDRLRFATGGPTRSASVRSGLEAVDRRARIIVVHDAARPFAGAALFRSVIDAVDKGADGAVPGLAVTDTIKQVDKRGVVVNTPDRSMLVAVQTPQAFAAQVLREAHEAHHDGSDDAALVEAMGAKVVVVPGHPDNRKLTVPGDMEWARARVAQRR